MNEKNRNTELEALISLIDEPDEEIFRTIRDRIFAHGKEAVPVLEHLWENTFDPSVPPINGASPTLPSMLVSWLMDNASLAIRSAP